MIRCKFHRILTFGRANFYQTVVALRLSLKPDGAAVGKIETLLGWPAGSTRCRGMFPKVAADRVIDFTTVLGRLVWRVSVETDCEFRF